MNYDFALTDVRKKMDYYWKLSRRPEEDPEISYYAECSYELFEYLFHYLLKAGDIFEDGAS